MNMLYFISNVIERRHELITDQEMSWK